MPHVWYSVNIPGRPAVLAKYSFKHHRNFRLVVCISPCPVIGQTAYNKSTQEPSRRLDVSPVVPGYALVPGRKYVWISSNPDPVMAAEIPKTTKLMMELAGIQ